MLKDFFSRKLSILLQAKKEAAQCGHREALRKLRVTKKNCDPRAMNITIIVDPCFQLRKARLLSPALAYLDKGRKPNAFRPSLARKSAGLATEEGFGHVMANEARAIGENTNTEKIETGNKCLKMTRDIEAPRALAPSTKGSSLFLRN